MKLCTQSFYNPFFTDINGKPYEIGDIIFFDKEGAICSTGRGWFGSNNSHRNGLILPCSCVLKRKPDFSLEGAFVIPSSEKARDNRTSRYNLYIPASVVGLKPPIVRKTKNGRAYTVTFTSDIDKVTVEKYIRFDAALCLVEEEVRKIGEKLSYCLEPNLPEIIKELQRLNREWKKQFSLIQAITEEDLQKQIDKTGRV